MVKVTTRMTPGIERGSNESHFNTSLTVRWESRKAVSRDRSKRRPETFPFLILYRWGCCVWCRAKRSACWRALLETEWRGHSVGVGV